MLARLTTSALNRACSLPSCAQLHASCTYLLSQRQGSTRQPWRGLLAGLPSPRGHDLLTSGHAHPAWPRESGPPLPRVSTSGGQVQPGLPGQAQAQSLCPGPRRLRAESGPSASRLGKDREHTWGPGLLHSLSPRPQLSASAPQASEAASEGEGGPGVGSPGGPPGECKCRTRCPVTAGFVGFRDPLTQSPGEGRGRK